MSLYHVYSPITQGEVLLAAIRVIERSFNFFTDLENRQDPKKDLWSFSSLLSFHRNLEKIPGCPSPFIKESILSRTDTLIDFFGKPWKNNEERLELLTRFWLLRDLAEAQVSAPQYPTPDELFGGSPFDLSGEQAFIGELLAGGIELRPFLDSVRLEMRPWKDLSPDRLDFHAQGACRNFEMGIATFSLGDLPTSFELTTRSFLFFILTRFLWWRKAIVEFAFDGGIREEFVGARKEDFVIRLLLEERERLQKIDAAVSEFNQSTSNALSDFVDFDWLNQPCVEAPATQISCGLAREPRVWWGKFRKK
jgi:hypothetical protein